MANVWVAPTGRLTKGHVLDVNRRAFDQALRDYDHLLYTKWNPKKLRGWGAWEIRRRPEKKTIVESYPWEGGTISVVDYHEVDIVNVVLTCSFLSYDQLRKIAEMDLFRTGKHINFSDKLESEERSYRDAQMIKARESAQYLAKQHKREIKDLKEMLLSGYNPAHIADHWGKK